MAKQNDQQTLTAPEPDIASTGLEGTGVDIPSLAELVKKEAKKVYEEAGVDGGSTTEAEKAEELKKAEEQKTAVEKSKEEIKEKTDEITISQEVKVGDEIKVGDALAPDGEYERGDGSKVKIKEGKVESVVDKEGKDITPETLKPPGTRKIDNPFLTEEKTVGQVEVKDFDQAAELLTSKTGVEIKEIGDIPKVVEKFTDLQENVETLTTEKNQLQDYKAVFEGMPNDLFSILTKWLNEEDYHEEIRSLARFDIDFSKSADSYSDKAMIELYNPGKFSEEDYQDMGDNTAMQTTLVAARRIYKTDQEKYNTVRTDYNKEQDSSKKAFDKSMSTSLESFKKDVPYLQDSHKQKVENILKGGIYGIMALFVDNDGNLKSESAKLVALALYGEQAINSQKRIASHKTETKVREEILKRVQTKEEKKVTDGGKAPSATDQVEAEKFITSVAPDQTQENPFLKQYHGDK